VHPNKWEVRFQNEIAIRDAVTTLVREALQEGTTLETAAKLFDETVKPVSSVTVTPAAQIAVSKPENAAPAPTFAKPTEKEIQKSNNSIPNSIYNHTNVHIEKPTVTAFSSEKPLQPHAVHSFNKPAPSVSAQNVLRSAPDSLMTPRSDVLPASKVPVVPAFDAVSKPVSDEKPALSVQSVPSFIEEKVEQVSHDQVDAAFAKLPVRMIGVVFNTYIILECNDRMLLCDQHAVHERLLFEQMLKACEGDAASQVLLAPEIVPLTHKEYEVFLEEQKTLKAAGFDAEDFGDRTVQLRAVPMVLGNAKSLVAFRDALDDLADGRQLSDQKRTERIIQMACKHAVKGGERLPEEGLFELVRRMIADNVTPTCPHGRPLIVEVTHRELDKRFRRIQN